MNPYQFGAVGNGVTDDSAAILSMLNSGATSFDFQSGDFLVSFAEGSTFKQFTGQSGITIHGNGAVIRDNRVYASPSLLSVVFGFDGCSGVVVRGLTYEGVPLASPSDPANGVGYLGATFVNLKNACSNVTMQAEVNNARYGLRAGDYSTPSEGYSTGITATLTGYRCGYPAALYLSENVTLDIDAEGTHRAAYLAGVHSFTVNARFKDQFIAPVQVLLTDAKTGTGTSRGCANGSVVATDTGSTAWKPNAWCIGLSLSRVDPGTVYENISMTFNVTGTDTIASTMGGLLINSSVAGMFPETYPKNWTPEITLRNITVSGSIDRSAQTIATHGIGEFYVLTDDGVGFEGAIDGLTFSQVSIINGSGSNPRPLFLQVNGAQQSVKFDGCDFGNYTNAFTSNLPLIIT